MTTAGGGMPPSSVTPKQSPFPHPATSPYPAITTPANYECFLVAGKVLGTVVNTSGGLEPATTACNHRITACINDYESSGNNDGNFGVEGGCTAQLQGKQSKEEQNTKHVAGYQEFDP